MSESRGPRGSTQRLTPGDRARFAGEGLLDAVGRILCDAACLPRKELFESWEVARRVLRRQRGGPVLDLAGGHGLVGWLIALQDPSTPSVTVVDRRIPTSAGRLQAALGARWPALAHRISHIEGELDAVPIPAQARVLGVHACGGLTDEVLDRAIAAGARVAVLPCCHSHAKLDDGGLSGWMEPRVAIDATRALRLRTAGYRVWTATIPADISPENRLLIGNPV